ncbi:tandem-95 repeat protein [Candidatus Woesearchaeota archaeon]|nr:tandem-95 repeat protein [Candidatus Woesearchaeota archaeon]
MRKLLMILMILLSAASFSSFAASVNAVTSGLVWQDGSREVTINNGDSVKFQVDVGSFSRPLNINLFLMNDEYEYIYERDLVVNDYIFGDFYLVTKEYYKDAGDYIIYLEVTDGRKDFQIQTLDLHVLASEAVNNNPVVTDIAITENEGLFSFVIAASDADNDKITDYESRVVAKGNEYSAFCEGDVCSFNSRDPTNDGFEFIRFDEDAVVKARAYDGKNWGGWYEKRFVIDNRDLIIEDEGDHEPVLQAIGNKEAFENSELRFSVTAADEDNDIVSINAENLPTGSTFINNGFTWKPSFDAVGHGGLINGILKFISFGILGNEPSTEFEVTFTVIDSKGNYDVEKIKVKVKDVNRLPTLDVFDVNVNEGELAKVETFVSDSDNDKVKVTFSSPLNNNGEWQTGFTDSGIHVVTVTADDSYNGVVRKNVNINVADVNRAPVIDDIIGAREVFEGELVELAVNAHDDDNDTLLYSVDSSLFSKSANVFRWQTNIGDKGDYSFNFRVEDGKNGYVSESVNINVKERINNIPIAEIVKPEKDLTIYIGDSVEFVGIGEDSDGSIIEYKWLINGEKVSNEKEFSYVFDKESTHLVEFLVKDDGSKWSEPDSVSIKVERKIVILNNAPVIDSVEGAREVFAGDTIGLTVNAHDADNDDLTYGITGDRFSQSGNKFIWRTSESDIGIHTFTVSVSDGKLSDYEAVRIVVKERIKVNNAPVITSSPVTAAREGAAYRYDVEANDPDGDALTFLLIKNPVGMEINPDTGLISWTPSFEQAGSHEVIVEVSDGSLRAAQRFYIIVANTNRAPFADDGSVTTDEDTAKMIMLRGSDADNDSLRFIIVSNPSNGILSNFNPRLGRVTYIPNNNFNGNDLFTFKVNDGISDSSNEGKISITVSPVNDAPIFLQDLDDQKTSVGAWFVYQVAAYDADNDPLTYSLIEKPRGMSIDSNGMISWRADKAGQYNVVVGVSDSKITVSRGFTLVVNEILRVNQAPIVGDIPDQAIKAGERFNEINLDTFVIDLDNNDNEISWIVSGASRLTVNIDSNRIARISYPSDFAGSERIEFTAVDPDGARDSDTAVFSVEAAPPAANRNPILTVKRDGNVVGKVTINEGENLVLSLEGSDPDNDSLRFEVVKLPAGATLNNEVFSWTPSNTQGGVGYMVMFKVVDLASNGELKGGSDRKIVTITVNDNLEPISIKPALKKTEIKRHVLNVKSIIVNNWMTVKKEELFDVDVAVDNKGNIKENDVRITLNIPQLNYYERSDEFDIKKKKTVTRSFSAVVPDSVDDEIIYAIVTVSSDKDEVTEVIGFLVE